MEEYPKQKTEKQNSVTLSLRKAFMILEVLAEFPNGCQLAKVVEHTQLNKTTVYRLLQTMQSLGYVEQNDNARNNRYRLSFRVVALGQRLIHEINIIQLTTPILTQLNEDIGLTVNLKMFHGTHSVILLKLEPQVGNIRTRTYMGMSVPLYSSASGKVFLAYRTEKYVRHYWETENEHIKKTQPSTIIDLDVFLDRLKFVRENEYALDFEENEMGIACIAAPIFDHLGQVNYVVSIAAQTSLMHINGIESYLKPLQKTVREISFSLGYEIDKELIKEKKNESI